MIHWIRLVILMVVGVLAPSQMLAQEIAALTRVANNTLRMPAEPPVYGIVTAAAFPLSFTQPVAITSPDGETNRLFIVEKPGRIVVITNLANPTRSVFLDISSRLIAGGEQGLLGLAFHPGYRTNRQFFVFYTVNAATPAGTGLHERLSRFEVSPDDPDRALADSERVMITQKDDFENHNGGDLHFGPDGYLYIGLGDEGSQGDAGNNSQRIDKDFFSGILRIDVDQRAESLPANPHPAVAPGTYAIPGDNPFVGATNFNGRAVVPGNVRTEFYAVGLRNPWRFSFDTATGFLYCGDVGGDLREEVDIITKGGNYGWAYREGTVNGPKVFQAPQGFASISPIQQYSHGNGTNQGNSITGGVVYRGQRFPSLSGAYIFADYVSGNIWALRYDGTNTVPFERMTRDAGIAGFGTDPRDGEVLLADHDEGRIKRFVLAPIAGQPALPETLAETGAFADVASLSPAAGVVPYELNLPFWSDGAIKRRWFSVPDTNTVIGFSREGNWTFPLGTVWVKHFEIELTNGVPDSVRRLETRFLVRNTNGVYGVTYRWDESQTNAVLVADEGMDETLLIQDAGGVRSQTWHYPSRSECLRCHTAAGGLALGFNTAQLNRSIHPGGDSVNQIVSLAGAGYFSNSVTNIATLPALVTLTNESASVEYRVRSYLAANCAYCHQPGAPGLGLFDARISIPTSEAGIVKGRLNDSKGIPENRVIRPGWLDFSALYQRVSTRGVGQMPPISRTMLDLDAIGLLRRWITGESLQFQTFEAWQVGNFDDNEGPEAARFADPDHDGAVNYLEFLLGSSPVLSLSPWRIGLSVTDDLVTVTYPALANRGFEVQGTINPADPGSWQPLDVPGNEPFFSSTNRTVVVHERLEPQAPKFYRVRVFER